MIVAATFFYMHCSLLHDCDFDLYIYFLAILSDFYSGACVEGIGRSCHDYFYKFVARRARFASALQAPSKVGGIVGYASSSLLQLYQKF